MSCNRTIEETRPGNQPAVGRSPSVRDRNPHIGTREPDHGPAGICATCTHARTCAFLRNQGPSAVPVQQCNEYESAAPGTAPIPREAGPRSAAPDLSEARLLGLCATCENRRTCIYRNAEGGVWHCEEYL